MPTTLKDEAAIVGIGQTEFSKNSGRSELSLACEAVSAAIEDAGLQPGDIDGMTTFTMDSSDLGRAHRIRLGRPHGERPRCYAAKPPGGRQPERGEAAARAAVDDRRVSRQVRRPAVLCQNRDELGEPPAVVGQRDGHFVDAGTGESTGELGRAHGKDPGSGDWERSPAGGRLDAPLQREGACPRNGRHEGLER